MKQKFIIILNNSVICNCAWNMLPRVGDRIKLHNHLYTVEDVIYDIDQMNANPNSWETAVIVTSD